MKKVGWASLGAIALTTGLAIVANLPEGLTPTTTIKTVVAGVTDFTIESSGDDRLLAIVVSYVPATDRNVSTATCDGLAMAQIASGSLTGIRDIEIWTKTAPATGTLAVTITMSDDSDAEVSATLLVDVDPTTPIAGESVGVGQGIEDAAVPAVGGDASFAVIVSSPSDVTLGLPSGFVEVGTDVGGTDARLSVLLDDDASEGQAALTFSGPADFAAIMVGLNVAP